MFEYTKTVLRKVSFSTDLFYKELNKAVERLLPYEIDELRIWLHKFTVNKPELLDYLILFTKNTSFQKAHRLKQLTIADFHR